MKKIPLIISLALALIGCTKQGAVPETQVSPGIRDGNPGISRDIVSLTADDAVTVAQMFCGRDVKTKGGGSKTVKNVVTISGKDGSANMYAVNFCNDEGFILVSATKKYAPILAFSEKGSFNDGVYETGMAVLLDEYEKNIDYCKTLPEESVEKYSKAWKDYEQKNCLKPELLTKSEDDLMAARAAAIAAWTNAGYECYALEQMENVVPSDVYNAWCQVAENNSNQHYDYFTNAIVIVETNDLSETISPLLSTSWSQFNGFNAYMDNIYGQSCPAGCSNIAMGQIMKYYEWPTCYSWDSMPNTYATTVTASFLRDLAEAASSVLMPDGTSTTYNGMYNAITSMPFCYSATKVSHSYVSTITELSHSRPVYMTGFPRIDLLNGHSWVCDGYINFEIEKTYTLKIVSIIEPPVQYETAGTPYTDYGSPSAYLHMNWGQGSNSLLWVYGDSSLAEYNQTNYNFIRSDFINITPNIN